MQVSNPNNIKIYNLSAGKTLPEWLSDRKKRSLQKSDVDIRRRINLIQDFEMPGVSQRVQISKDGQFVLATGSYKPRVRCYDVTQLSMKFERCFDADVVNFEILSEDYSKVVFLQCDRYVEFHAQYGKYFRLRIPKFGRDLAYHTPSCDLYLVGDGREIFRLNLEQGKFLNPYVTDATELNTCDINPEHHLILCGTNEGRVEAWDPRSRHRVGILDCAVNSVVSDNSTTEIPSVTSLAFADGLTMAVGTSTGHVLIYDIRSDRPRLVKDHLYGLPVRKVCFLTGSDKVASLDEKIVRFWDKNSGKTITSIEPGSQLNDLCLLPKTGMMFIANEAQKILTYYIPQFGPAPSWCYFLDNITEELEEGSAEIVYDDYKFVTRKELDELSLGQLVGTNLLRAYMHGYYIDAKLYRKAKTTMVDAFNFEEYRKRRINEKIEAERKTRVVGVQKLPNVNKSLAEKLMAAEEEVKTIVEKGGKPAKGTAILHDDRFGDLFVDPDFEVDEASEEFRLLNPVVKNVTGKAQRKLKAVPHPQFERADEEVEGPSFSDDNDDTASSSDDDHRAWATEVKRQHKLIRHEERYRRQEEDAEANIEPAFYTIKSGQEYNVGSRKNAISQDVIKKSMAERVAEEEGKPSVAEHSSSGHRQMTFQLKKSERMDRERENAERHHEERKQIVRSARGFSSGRARGFGGGRGRGYRGGGRGRGFGGGRGRGGRR